MDTGYMIAGVAGVLASGATEAFNRLTPNTVLSPAALRGVAGTVAAALVVGVQVKLGGAPDWDAVAAQVFLAWGVSLAAHDVASPRK